MKLNAIFSASLITIASLALTLPARADSVKAHCTYYVNGSNKAKASMPCRFYQAQGHIVLTWEDGVVSDFMPEKGRSMVYRDQYGGMVYRELGDDGLNIFKMEKGTIYTTFD